MKTEKLCKYPGCTEPAGHNHYRAWCVFHGEQKRKADRQRYNESHEDYNLRWVTCSICKIKFRGHHDLLFCPNCRKKIDEQNQNNSKYIAKKKDGHRIDEHRQIAKQVGAITQHNDVVHHMDGNKANNDPSNLVVLSLANHTRLHAHLRAERIRQPNKTIAQLSWEFIWQNFIPYCFCNQVPGYHFPIDD